MLQEAHEHFLGRLRAIERECGYPAADADGYSYNEGDVMENWVFEPEMLALYAFHYETGEVMPDELVQKIRINITFQTEKYNYKVNLPKFSCFYRILRHTLAWTRL